MGTSYDMDYAAWAFEQVALLRAGRLEDVDIAHIAEEIEDVGTAQYHSLNSRMRVLIEHLLKWRSQPGRRGDSWRTTIDNQREEIAALLEESPSLSRRLDDEEWLSRVWKRAQRGAQRQTGIDMPAHWIWTVQQVLDVDFLPD
jgi:hypothetical protein